MAFGQELEGAVRKGGRRIIFQDTTDWTEPIVYERILSDAKHIIRMFIKRLDGTVLNRHWGLLNLLKSRLDQRLTIDIVLRDASGHDPELLEIFKGLSKAHQENMRFLFASDGLKNATHSSRWPDDPTAFITFTTGDDHMFRQDVYKGAGEPTGFNGFLDYAHVMHLNKIFEDFARSGETVVPLKVV